MKNALLFLRATTATTNFSTRLFVPMCAVILFISTDLSALGRKSPLKGKPIVVLPTLSYGAAKTFTAGTAVSTVTPTSTGVLPSAYNNGTINYASGFTNPRAIARDSKGNIYIADGGANSIIELPVGGGARITLASGFASAVGVAVDGFGNVFVADYGNNAVYKIPVHTTSVVSVGSGFSGPIGVAADVQGNVYVADYTGKDVQKIPVGGGSPVYIANSLNFVAPSGVAIDAAGNVFVTDLSGNTLKELPATGGPVVTLASGLSSPYDVTVDPSGNLFIADAGSGSIKELVGGTGSPITLSSALNTGTGVITDGSGNVIVADYYNTSLQLIAPSGGYYLNTALPAGLSFNNSTGAISGTPQVASPATNYTITAYNASGAFSANVSIRVINPLQPVLNYGGAKTYISGTAIPNLAPTSSRVGAAGYSNKPITIAVGFQNPIGISLDANDNIYTADFNTGKIYEVQDGSSIANVIGSGFTHPEGVAADEAGNVFIADQTANTVTKLPAGGGTLIAIGSGYSAPSGLAVDQNDNVYVSNYNINYVTKITPNSSSYIILNSNTNGPGGIAVDARGNVYFGSYTGGNHAVVKIPAAGGPATVIATGFYDPIGLTADLAGNVYVVDDLYNNVKEIPANGGPTVVVGSGLLYPGGIAIDEAGNLFVTDGGTGSIKELKPTGGYFITPALPAGLVFDSNTGIISGTALAPSAATDYTITAYNAGGFTESIVNIKVNAPVAPAISYTGPNSYTMGAAITPLAPTSARVALAGYSNSPITLGTGFQSLGGLGRDAAGNIYVADINGAAIKKIPAGGGAVTTISLAFPSPLAVAVDPAGDIFVVDNSNNTVTELPVGGGAAIPKGSGYSNPQAVAVDASGNLYITNLGNNTVLKLPAGSSTPVSIGSGFLSPAGIAVDAYGNVFVGDAAGGTSAIKEIPASGGPTFTIAGGFFDAAAIAVDAAGNIYVADELNRAIKMIPAGSGTPVIISSGILYPSGIIIDGAGNLYVADNGTEAVEKIVPTGGYFISPALPAGLTFNSITGTINGTPAAASPPTPYTIKGYNSGGVGTATVTIGTVASTNAALASLVISKGALSPAFATATTTYIASVGNTVTTIAITPTAADAGATIKVNGVATATAPASIPLSVGANTITTVVTAQDGITTKTYTLTVTRAKSTNAFIATLALSHGVLSPTFSHTTTSYAVGVGAAITSLTVTPTTSDPTATVTVNGTAVISGTASGSLPLAAGTNVITIIGTAQDGTTKATYTVTVTRAGQANIVRQQAGIEQPLGMPQSAGDGVAVHPGLSPNGDGINDFLVIDGITAYPDNKLQVMNRNGQLVYETKNYDNGARVFDGHSNKTGAMQSPGTYFYSLNYVVDGVAKHKTGFVVLKY